MLATTASSILGDPMTKLSPTDLMRAALIVEGQAIDLAWASDPATLPGEVEDLRRLALGLRELACSTD